MTQQALHTFRQRLASHHALLHYSLLGIAAGVLCGIIMKGFHLLAELPQYIFLPSQRLDDFESLPAWTCFSLPLISGLTIGLLMHFFAKDALRTGIPHTVDCLHNRHGQMPGKNLIVQFFLGALALGTGQSGGREGPAVHLGAGINSVIGKKLLFPNNSLRLLIGCGTAAAIAAAFNTPIAGVIFAMEVVMMEYTIAGFIPIILAAITATIITRSFEGAEKIFIIPDVNIIAMSSLAELPLVALLGLIVGAFAAGFIYILKQSLKLADKPIWLRTTLAGAITGCFALFIPEVMGIGYDSLNDLLANNMGLAMIIALLIAKLIATASSCGLGVPIGLVGPNLLIGACIGGAIGIVAKALFPGLAVDEGFYVLLGMGAMMGAVMNAPLAALMALIELTENTYMIFPGMLAITIATLTHTELFKQQSATQTILQTLKSILRTDPLSLALQRTGASSIMERKIMISPMQVSQEFAKTLLNNAEKMDCQGLLSHHEENSYYFHWKDMQPLLQATIANNETSIDLLNMAPYFKKVAPLHLQATLREAIDIMNEKDLDSVYIGDETLAYGVLERGKIFDFTTQPQP